MDTPKDDGKRLGTLIFTELKDRVFEAASIISGNNQQAEHILNNISLIAKNLMAVKASNAINSVQLKNERMSILLSYMAISRWLDWSVDLCKDFYNKQAHEVPQNMLWMHSLVRHARNMVEYRQQEKMFSPEIIGISQISENKACTIKGSKEYVKSPEDLLERTISITTDVLCKWTGFDEGQERWKMWMLDILIKHFGVEIISLDVTWDIFTTTKKIGVLKSNKIKPTLGDFATFTAAVKTHPMSNNSSTETVIAKEIYSLIKKWSINAIYLAESKPGAELRTQKIWDVQEHILRKRGNFFGVFIRQALQVIYGEVSKPTKLQLYIMADPDKRSPFRGRTQNRLRMTGLGGPYDPDNMRKNSGLFSAAIWHGITLHTPFEMNGPCIFQNIEEWNKAIVGLSKPEICNVTAHGTASRRSPDNAEHYWTSVCQMDWEQFAAKGQTIEFWDIFSKLYNIKHDKNGPQPFPQLGPIGAFHMAADFAYGLCANNANAKTIGLAMEVINRGSSKGAATLLGINIDKNKKGKLLSASECARGAETAVQIIQNILNDEEQNDIGSIDNVLAEHSLCKFQGVWKKGFLNG